jgi:hypothetical protein
MLTFCGRVIVRYAEIGGGRHWMRGGKYSKHGWLQDLGLDKHAWLTVGVKDTGHILSNITQQQWHAYVIIVYRNNFINSIFPLINNQHTCSY